MWAYLLIRLSTLSLGLSYVACTTPQQQNQLASLHERVNQMIRELYSSPLLSKVKAATASEEAPSSSSETTYPAAPTPQVVFVSPPSYSESTPPTEYTYSFTSNPVPKAYNFDYSTYQPSFAPPFYSPPVPRSYPEYPRSAYPQSVPQPQPLPPFASPSTYRAPFPSSQYSLSPFPAASQPGFPPVLPGPYPPQGSCPYQPPYSPQISYPPAPYPAPPLMPSFVAPYPPMPFPMPSPAPFPPVPQYAAPSPFPYPSQMPAPYSPSYSYPQSMYPPPVYPKPSDILPQPQYEYSN